MADRYLVDTGDWSDPGVWSTVSGGAPGASPPGTGDRATIERDYEVTITAELPIRRIEVWDGSVVQNGDIVIDSTSQVRGINFGPNATGKWRTNGSVTAPRKIRCASTAAQMFSITAYDLSPETRDINFDYVIFEHMVGWFGNEHINIVFNDLYRTNYNYPILETVSPLSRLPILREKNAYGRDRGRTYPEGNRAGTVVCAGYVQKAGAFGEMWATRLRLMEKSRLPYAFFHKDAWMLRCHIESIRWQPVEGATRIPFTMVLVEDL